MGKMGSLATFASTTMNATKDTAEIVNREITKGFDHGTSSTAFMVVATKKHATVVTRVRDPKKSILRIFERRVADFWAAIWRDRGSEMLTWKAISAKETAKMGSCNKNAQRLWFERSWHQSVSQRWVIGIETNHPIASLMKPPNNGFKI